MTPRSPTPSRRADAQRNRERILRVAADALLADPDASLNLIAKQAGVGAGTLYRHFPAREDLLLALYGREVIRLSAAVEELLTEHAPVDAFTIWSERLAQYLRLKHGLGEALSSAAVREMTEASYGPVIEAIQQLLDAGTEAGEFRPGLAADDVLLLMGCLWRVAPGDEGVAQAHRLLATLIDGLRPHPAARAS